MDNGRTFRFTADNGSLAFELKVDSYLTFVEYLQSILSP